MYALRRQIAAPRTHELPRELARQSEAKRKQSPQSEANVCRGKCMSTQLHRTPNNAVCLSRTKDHLARSPFLELQAIYLSLELAASRLSRGT